MKKQYKSPTLKVVEFKSEHGFATSGFTSTTKSYQEDTEWAINIDLDMEYDKSPRNEQYNYESNDQSFWQ